LILQLLATISVGIGATVIAQETQHAYYTEDPSEVTEEVITLPTDKGELDVFNDIMQVQAEVLQVKPKVLLVQPKVLLVKPKVLLVKTEALPEPFQFQDGKIPSSSDAIVDDDFSLPTPNRVIDPFSDDIQMDFDGVLAPLPVEDLPPMDGDQQSFPSTRLARGKSTKLYASAPSMVGDFFGGGFLLSSGQTVPIAGGDRRFKVAENVSPIPRDRILFNYNHFHNSLTDINGASRDLDRFTFGFEKTMLHGKASIETRLPLAVGLDSRQSVGGTDTRSTELGNLAFAFKANVISRCNWMVSAGTSLTVPTGDDYVQFNGAAPELEIQNDAVHLAPFVGFLAQPNRCCFAQGFIQADFDLGGNDVFSGTNGFEGVLQDQNLLFIDASIGRWLHRSPCNTCSVAAMAELHYTATLNDTDAVAGVSNPFNRMDILNATAALDFQVGKTSLRVGGAAPLRSDEEQLFDSEIILQLNRYF
jgi:hypothetical protein